MEAEPGCGERRPHSPDTGASRGSRQRFAAAASNVNVFLPLSEGVRPPRHLHFTFKSIFMARAGLGRHLTDGRSLKQPRRHGPSESRRSSLIIDRAAQGRVPISGLCRGPSRRTEPV